MTKILAIMTGGGPGAVFRYLVFVLVQVFFGFMRAGR